MSVQYKSYVSLMLSGVHLGHMAKSWINIDFTNLTELNYVCGSVSSAFSIYIFCIHTKCYLKEDSVKLRKVECTCQLLETRTGI